MQMNGASGSSLSVLSFGLSEAFRRHELYQFLVDTVGQWSQAWVPSLALTTPGSDFDQWMSWCLPHLDGVLRYEEFDALLRLVHESHGSGEARRLLASEICFHGWYLGAGPRG
eukprot:7389975-Pyramimonas_sp.AAC.1